MAIIAVIISIIALFQNVIQTKISNKQHLFDRRLEKYLIIKDLIILYKDNRILLVGNEKICEALDFPFVLLTNCALLEDIGEAIYKPLQVDIHGKYLYKIETMDKYATEIELLWNTDCGRLACKFVRQYRELLRLMYKQKICIDIIKKDNPQKALTLDKFENKAKEQAIEIGLFDIIKDIDSTYNKIIENDVEQLIVKSIRL